MMTLSSYAYDTRAHYAGSALALFGDFVNIYSSTHVWATGNCTLLAMNAWKILVLGFH